MPTEYRDVAWLPLCVLLSLAAVGAAVLVSRRRGWGAAVRVLALALLPLGLYWSGLLRLFWTIGTAIGRFATGLVLSPRVSVGLGLLALFVAMWFAGGVLQRRGIGRARRPAVDGGRPASPPAQRGQGAGEFDDVEELLRRRGIK